MRLHAQHQPIALMRADCHVCRAEGLASRSQVLITSNGHEVQAQLYQIDSDLLALDEVALSEEAWDALGIRDGDSVHVRHPPVLESLAGVRQRIYGRRLGEEDLAAIVRDVVRGRYTDVHLSAFLTATATLPLSIDETIFLTKAMVEVGDRLSWQAPIVVDKHCVGGLPGNRTTPLVVAIAAANGLVMPKTSSRAITSPAGTADTMQCLDADAHVGLGAFLGNLVCHGDRDEVRGDADDHSTTHGNIATSRSNAYQPQQHGRAHRHRGDVPLENQLIEKRTQHTRQGGGNHVHHRLCGNGTCTVCLASAEAEPQKPHQEHRFQRGTGVASNRRGCTLVTAEKIMRAEGGVGAQQVHHEAAREIFDVVLLEPALVGPHHMHQWTVYADVPHKDEQQKAKGIHTI